MLCLILRDVKGPMEFNDLMVGQMELAFSEETWQRYSHPIYQRFLGTQGLVQRPWCFFPTLGVVMSMGNLMNI